MDRHTGACLFLQLLNGFIGNLPGAGRGFGWVLAALLGCSELAGAFQCDTEFSMDSKGRNSTSSCDWGPGFESRDGEFGWPEREWLAWLLCSHLAGWGLESRPSFHQGLEAGGSESSEALGM